MLSGKSSLRGGRTPIHLTYLLLCSAALFGSLLLSTDGVFNSLQFFSFSIPLNAPCLFKLATGFNCPVCGMTRCFIYMSHLRLGEALSENFAGVPLYLLCLFEVPYRAFLLLKRGGLPPVLHKLFSMFEITLFAIFVLLDIVFFFSQFFIA